MTDMTQVDEENLIENKSTFNRSPRKTQTMNKYIPEDNKEQSIHQPVLPLENNENKSQNSGIITDPDQDSLDVQNDKQKLATGSFVKLAHDSQFPIQTEEKQQEQKQEEQVEKQSISFGELEKIEALEKQAPIVEEKCTNNVLQNPFEQSEIKNENKNFDLVDKIEDLNKSEIGELQNLMEDIQQKQQLKELFKENQSLIMQNEQLQQQLQERDNIIKALQEQLDQVKHEQTQMEIQANKQKQYKNMENQEVIQNFDDCWLLSVEKIVDSKASEERLHQLRLQSLQASPKQLKKIRFGNGSLEPVKPSVDKKQVSTKTQIHQLNDSKTEHQLNQIIKVHMQSQIQQQNELKIENQQTQQITKIPYSQKFQNKKQSEQPERNSQQWEGQQDPQGEYFNLTPQMKPYYQDDLDNKKKNQPDMDIFYSGNPTNKANERYQQQPIYLNDLKSSTYQISSQYPSLAHKNSYAKKAYQLRVQKKYSQYEAQANYNSQPNIKRLDLNYKSIEVNQTQKLTKKQIM